MRPLALILALLWATVAHAQPVPISPIGQVYTVPTPIKATVQDPEPCHAQKVLVTQTFSWQPVAGATRYELAVYDGCTTGPYTVDADVDAATYCTSTVCTYTPATQIASSVNGNWQVRVELPAPGPWSPITIFAVNYIGVNTFTTTGCQWYYSTDAPGVSTRVIDYSSDRAAPFNIFPRATWIRISLAGMVPSGTQAVQTKLQYIQGKTSPEAIIMVKTRRHTSPGSEDPEPYGGAMYGTAYRDRDNEIVLLGPNQDFDFAWNTAANGNAPPGTATSWGITMMVTGYCR